MHTSVLLLRVLGHIDQKWLPRLQDYITEPERAALTHMSMADMMPSPPSSSRISLMASA